MTVAVPGVRGAAAGPVFWRHALHVVVVSAAVVSVYAILSALLRSRRCGPQPPATPPPCDPERETRATAR